MISGPGGTADDGAGWLRVEKRWRATALQDPDALAIAPRMREASWSAPALWRLGRADDGRGENAMDRLSRPAYRCRHEPDGQQTIYRN